MCAVCCSSDGTDDIFGTVDCCLPAAYTCVQGERYMYMCIHVCTCIHAQRRSRRLDWIIIQLSASSNKSVLELKLDECLAFLASGSEPTVPSLEALNE